MAATITKLQRIIAANWLWEYDSQAYVNSDILPNTPGNVVLSVLANNINAPTLYLMFFDGTAVPSNTAVPVFMPIPLAQGTPLNLKLNDTPGGLSMFGHTFTKGIVYAVSTTSAALTIDSTNSVWVNLRYQN